MKKIFSIIVFCTWALTSISQGIVQRGSSSVTNQDDRIKAKLNFYMPVASDTTLNGGLDSSGAQLMVVKPSDTSIYVRMPKPGGGRKWVKMLKSGDTNGVMRFNSRVGAVSLLASDVNTALGYVPVQGNGTNLQYLAGDGSKVTFPITTLTQGANVTITGTFPHFTISSTGGGGSVNLNSSRQDNQFAIKSSPTDSTIILQADSTNKAGAYPVTDRKKVQRQELPLSYAELRALTTYGAQVHYKTLINKQFADFYFDPASTQADDSVMCVRPTAISVGSPGRYLRYYENYILANWFGLVGNGVADDSRNMQKAIEYTHGVYSHTGILKINAGQYKVKNLILWTDRNNDGQPEYTTMTIEGCSPVYDHSGNAGPVTTFVNLDTHSFIIGGQKMLNTHINNISFIGNVSAPGTIKELIERTDADWTSGGFSNDQFSPSALVVVDFAHSLTPSVNRYPGNAANGIPMADYYTGTSYGGSSLFTMDGCSYRNTIVGIMISPNGYTQNCDNMFIKNFHTYGCRTFYASGQSQSRDNHITNGYLLGGTEFFINCSEYGNGYGSPPTTSYTSLAGGLKYLYQSGGGLGSLRFNNTIAESTWSLGKSGTLPTIFDNCDIRFLRPDVDGLFAAPVMAQGGLISFPNSILGYIDNDYRMGFAFNNAGVVHSAGPDLQSPSYNNDRNTVSYVNSNPIVLKGDAIDESTIQGIAVVPDEKIYSTNGGNIYTIKGNVTDKIFIENHTITALNVSDGSGYIKTTGAAKYQVGDFLMTGIDYANDIYDSIGMAAVGYVRAIGNDTVYIKYATYGLKTTVTYGLYVVRTPTFANRTIGDVASGSNVITNVQFDRVNFNAGQKIKGQGIPLNTYVVSRTSTTITMSQNATATSTNVALYDAIYKRSYSPASSSLAFPFPVFIGDEVNYVGYDSAIYKGIYVTNGVPTGTGTPVAVLNLIRYHPPGGGSGVSLLQVDSLVTADAILNQSGSQGTANYNINGIGRVENLIIKGGNVDRDVQLGNRSVANGLGILQVYQNTSANTSSIIELVPKGTGSGYGFMTAFTLYGTDFFADATNYESFGLLAVGTRYNIVSNKGGTGTARPFAMVIDGSDRFIVTSTAVNFPGLAGTGNRLTYRNSSGDLLATVIDPDSVSTVARLRDSVNALRLLISSSNPASQINDSLNALRATLLFDVVHTVTTTNTTPVTGDTLALAANTQATYHLTFHGFDNTGVLNDALWYERRVLIKYSDGVVPTPTVQVIGTDIAEGTLNAVPPPVTFVVSGTLVFIKVASSSTMNIPWQISRTLTDVSAITAH